MKNLRYLNKYFIKYRRHLIVGVFITIIARVFSLVMPEYVQILLTEVESFLRSKSTDVSTVKTDLVRYIIIIIAAALVSGFFSFLMRQAIINVSRYIEFDLKNEIFRHYERLSLRFYKNNRTGDLMNRISEDVNKVRMYVGPAIMYSVQTTTLFLCVIPLMFYTSPTLTYYALLPLPILSVLVFYVSKNINKRTTVVQEFLSKLSTFSQETFSGIRIIKAYGLEKEIDKQAADLSEKGKEKSMKLAGIQSWFLPLILLLIGLSNVFVIYIGGRLYINGQIESIGVIVKFSIYVIMLTWPVATVGWVSSIVQQAEASQKRINEFLKIKPNIINHNPKLTSITKGNITFKNVSFTYPETNIKALDNISFDIKSGQTVAFLGKIGSGKSTILELMSRLYDSDQGEILIDEKPIKNINLESLRRAIGYVPQEAFLFSDTIKNNLLFGNIDATEQEIKAVTQKADIHDSIMGFEKAYQTVLGERGITLSGGQKQRISIARALLKNPPIYLFDDCLSAVDTATEERILSNLNSHLLGSTSIIVTHRVSSSKNADHIFILENGHIIQEGTHEALIKIDGYYKTLYETQYH